VNQDEVHSLETSKLSTKDLFSFLNWFQLERLEIAVKGWPEANRNVNKDQNKLLGAFL
jgi:hypothetical protein